MHVMNDQPSPVSLPTPEQMFGRQLRLLRLGRGWTQQDVAVKMQDFGYQWSQATVTRLEAATRPIRLNEVFDLAGLFDVPAAQFLEPASQDFDWENVESLDSEIEKLTRERDAQYEHLRKSDDAASALARTRAEFIGLIVRTEFRLETLKRWRPQAHSGEPPEAGDGSEPTKP